MQQPRTSIRLLAFVGVLIFFSLIWRYTLEFKIFTNTIGIQNLVVGSLFLGGIAAAIILYALRNRLTPWGNHLPEILTIAVFSVLFAQLAVSLLNRAGGTTEHQPFLFVSEMPYLSSNYGLIKGEKIKPSGIRLTVKEHGKVYRFQYKKQAYFPLTKPGETVLLPVRKGLFGVRVVDLK